MKLLGWSEELKVEVGEDEAGGGVAGGAEGVVDADVEDEEVVDVVGGGAGGVEVLGGAVEVQESADMRGLSRRVFSPRLTTRLTSMTWVCLMG